MDLKEKVKIINEMRSKNYLSISPRCIQNASALVNNYESLDLYEKMDENSKKFADEEIVDLITSANNNANGKSLTEASFYLVFCGDFNDIKDNIAPKDFILENKNNIVAVYQYVTSSYKRNFFVGFNQSETIYNYGYIYLNLGKVIDMLSENKIKVEIDDSVNRYAPLSYDDDRATKFIFSYSLEKEEEKGYQISKKKEKK